MKLQVVPRFPASIIGSSPITVTRSGGVITIGINDSAIIISAGATTVAPFLVDVSQSQVLLKKAIGSASGILLPLSATKLGRVLIKDGKGDADTNPISVFFTGGELCDGLAVYSIVMPYGGAWFSPLPAGGGYYIS